MTLATSILRVTAAAAALCTLGTPASAGVEYFGAQAQQIWALWSSGQGACFVTRTVVNPATNVTEQQFCECVASVDGSAVDSTTKQLTALVVTFGPEQQCNSGPPATGPTAKQRADAAAEITKDDALLAAWNQFLQTNIWRSVDIAQYRNDPTYKAEVDQWVASWGTYGRQQMDQIRADREAQVSIANAPVPGGGAGRGAGAAPGAGGTGLLNAGEMQH